MQRQTQDFPDGRGGPFPEIGGKNMLFDKLIDENRMKMKEIGRRRILSTLLDLNSCVGDFVQFV